jgi:hypothetical protein
MKKKNKNKNKNKNNLYIRDTPKLTSSENVL